MSKLFMFLSILLLFGCAHNPQFKTTKCLFKAKWGMPESNLRTYKNDEHLYKYSWKERGFHSGDEIIDLAVKTEDRDFSCKDVSYFQVELTKTWKDILFEFIPFYSSTHVTVYYLKEDFISQ